VIYALACTLLVAGADEWHQHFLPDRTGTPQDVLLDMIGACILQLLFWLVMFVIGIGRNRSNLETV
jgi:VanZ family protein